MTDLLVLCLVPQALTPLNALCIAVRGEELHISRITEGRIVERWGQWDNLGMMQQLGVLPPPGE